MDKEKVQLGVVQETLLVPLHGRALDARSRRPLLGDVKAAELEDRIDYDFAKFRGPSVGGGVLRSVVFDEWVRRFLAEHPAGTVVEMGVGLNTRSDRLANGTARWFDVDLPDTIALRRKFFTDDEHVRMIAASVTEEGWLDEVAATGGPYFFVGESVLFYLEPGEVRAVLGNLTGRFPGSRIAFDTGSRTMMSNQERNPVFRALTARMRWTCDDPRELAAWGLRLEDSRTVATPQPGIARSWPWRYRIGLPLVARILPAAVNAYKLNLFTAA